MGVLTSTISSSANGMAATLRQYHVMNFTYSYGTSTTNTGRLLSRTDAIQPDTA